MNLQTYLINVSTFPDGYASPEWKGKPIFTEAKKITPEAPIITNAPNILLFYTNESAYFLSSELKSTATSVTLADMDNINKLMIDNCGAIIILNPVRANAYEHKKNPASNNDIEVLSKLFISVYDKKDGKILMYKDCIK
ncbi:hypothetical protein SDC9_177447 [bioreactor metagenome]|uniref:Uncharacterized protein n=1 Tax=bioreactor metagenome TaxID=1076179 RepID=A0A645GUH7_9ZZZZ